MVILRLVHLAYQATLHVYTSVYFSIYDGVCFKFILSDYNIEFFFFIVKTNL